jgi:3-oxoacyl-[acyl-carrier protein] reductase
MKKFDLIKVGDKAEISHTITSSDIEKFVNLTGDDNKIHIDSDFAKNTYFKKTVAHGMLGASFISTVIGTKLPGDGALWFSQNLDFILPVRIGDKLTIYAEVKKKNDRDQTIELSTNIFNQHKQKVIGGYAKVKIIEQNKDSLLEKEGKNERNALIIGGTGGIGRATCISLAEKGFNIILHYRSNHEEAEKIKLEVSKYNVDVMTVKSDIINFDEVIEMAEKIERKFNYLTALINCSTPKIPTINFSSIEWSDISKHIDLNIKGSFNLIKCLLPLMEKKMYGKIVNITTQYIDDPKLNLLHYITAKSALQGFSKGLATDLASKGIRVNIVSPGMTITDLISDVPERIRLLTEARTPLNRLALPEDVAKAITYLVLPDSDFLTGETIRVNGGQVMI